MNDEQWIRLTALRRHARQMRQNPTPAEAAMWERLRRRRFHNLKFRRQVVLYPYIADFVSREAAVAVELDGEVHDAEKEFDETRDRLIERNHGLRVIRFTNERILRHPGDVWRSLERYLGLD